MFKDVSGITCGSDIPLIIDKDAVLGKGSSALVVKGELCNPVSWPHSVLCVASIIYAETTCSH